MKELRERCEKWVEKYTTTDCPLMPYEIVRALEAFIKSEAGLAIQDFIHGRRKLCLVCGEKEPCHLKDDPQSSCTFEPTPMELLRLVKEKDAEIAKLKEWQQITIGAGTDQETVVRMAAAEYTAIAKQCWQDKYNDMLATAVQFAEALGRSDNDLSVYIDAQDFLASPEVQAWRRKGSHD